MAEQDQDKSEEASPFKLREARKKGQVSKSLELNAFAVVSVCLLSILLFKDRLASGTEAMFRTIVSRGFSEPMEPGAPVSWMSYVLFSLLNVFGPVLVTIVLAAVLVNLAQVKFVVSSFPLKPDFQRLNPAAGFKKLFSRRVLYELIKAALKIGFLFVFILLMGMPLVNWLVSGVTLQLSSVGGWATDIVVQVVLVFILMLLPIVIVDKLYTRRDFLRQMRMSRKEVKDEHKRLDGNPEQKKKRRQSQKELLEKSKALANVKSADLVVVNPTHYAVALRFERHAMIAPKVVSLGAGALALEIKRRARIYGKPIVARPKLARQLYRSSRLDQPVSPDSYQDVAEVYQWFYQR
ncbi:flagellar biosynthesis protein FlhB [Microbulbifer sp. ALW1]|uniref:EscU/YscU/HrcU family type III secretion system export apparatus switch protein n=1 Tax=Microbulbifer sp. (strain ALW1) TaxID=1516059 RepID=UPI001358283B|nr:EscU/YscU/HrcU family type III secretion system export apparatus switch protein [Microbulbifer sp. ALW1]